jgi:hypothetical protein
MSKFKFLYGELSFELRGGHRVVSSEAAHTAEVKHFSDKVNYNRPPNGDEIERVKERAELKKRMKNHPDGKHAPTKYNQIIRI